jgi:hypothetical protein
LPIPQIIVSTSLVRTVPRTDSAGLEVILVHSADGQRRNTSVSHMDVLDEFITSLQG